MKRFIIYGCESRGDKQSAYMTRYVFPRLFGLIRPTLHVFHRSDADEHHDHPWNFVSIMLWGGYIEETPCPLGCTDETGYFEDGDYAFELVASHCGACKNLGRLQKRVWPGMILYRKAEHRHRVVLIDGKKAVTLCLMFKRRREWGFFTKQGWQNFREYFKERGC